MALTLTGRTEKETQEKERAQSSICECGEASSGLVWKQLMRVQPVMLKWSGCMLGKAVRQLTQELASTWKNLAVEELRHIPAAAEIVS